MVARHTLGKHSEGGTVEKARRIGIARGSLSDLASQTDALLAAGCDRIITLTQSQSISNILNPHNGIMQSGDTVVVQTLSALTVSIAEMPTRFRQAISNKIYIEVLDPPVSTASQDVRNMLDAWLSVRKAYIAERLRRRVQRSRPEGRLRKFTVADWPRIKEELKTEKKAHIAKRYGVTRQTLYTFLDRMKQLDENHESGS